MRTFITLMALVAVSAGPAFPQTAERADGYASALAKASSSGSFLVTWVGVQTRINNADAIMAFSSSLDGFNAGEVVISGPWHNGRHVIYATLSSPTRQQIEAALAQAREEWASAQRQVSRTAIPFVWPLPSAGETVDPDLTRNGPLPKGFDISGMARYKRAAYTQKIYTVEGDPTDHIDPVHRLELENKDWHQSGGMLGVANFRSDLYRNRIADGDSVTSWVWAIDVKNSITNPATGEKYTQPNKARATIFPDGSRFLDVLSNTKTGNVFEIRQRLKDEGRWRNAVIFTDESERPAGYAGLTKSCVSCHAQAGTGIYAAGLVPGADQTLSIGFKALER